MQCASQSLQRCSLCRRGMLLAILAVPRFVLDHTHASVVQACIARTCHDGLAHGVPPLLTNRDVEGRG